MTLFDETEINPTELAESINELKDGQGFRIGRVYVLRQGPLFYVDHGVMRTAGRIPEEVAQLTIDLQRVHA